MLFQTFVEVQSAKDGVDDGENDEENGNDRKTGQILANWQIMDCKSWLVHSEKFEAEVGQCADVENDGNNHTKQVLSSSGPCSAQ